MKIFFEIILTIFTVSTLCFFILKLTPGDAVSILSSYNSSDSDLESLRHELGLDRSLIIQYKDWLFSAVKLEFGKSYYSDETALEKVLKRLPSTAKLIIPPFILSIVFSILLSFLSLVKPWGWLDQIILLIIGFFSSVTPYIVNMLLTIVFSIHFKVFPLYNNLTLPVIGLTLVAMPNLLKFLRNSLIEEQKKDYYMFFYMLGIPRQRLFLIHLLPNVLNTFLPIVSINFGALIGFSLLADKAFGISGLASLLIDSIQKKDYNIIQLCVIVFTLIYIIPYYLLRPNKQRIKDR